MAKEALMKGKLVLTAIVLSGGIGLGIQSISAQSVPEEGQRARKQFGENPVAGKTGSFTRYFQYFIRRYHEGKGGVKGKRH
jgi:hypothetical protein